MTTITLTIERGDDSTNDWRELDVEVTGHVVPYRRATLLDDEEGGTIEDVEAYCASEVVELTPRELARAVEMLGEQAREDADEARCRRWDWAREKRLEREI